MVPYGIRLMISNDAYAFLIGHEDATEDFGIYEFVAIPGRLDSTQVRLSLCRFRQMSL